jgi:hypothetical protein
LSIFNFSPQKLPIVYISSLLAADAKTIRVFVLVKQVSVVHIFTLPAVGENKWWGLCGGRPKKCQLYTFLHCSQQAKKYLGCFFCVKMVLVTHISTRPAACGKNGASYTYFLILIFSPKKRRKKSGQNVVITTTVFFNKKTTTSQRFEGRFYFFML